MNTPSTSDHRWITGAVCGLLGAGVTVAVGELAAALVGARSSPVVVISDTVVRFTPQWLKEFGTSSFGTNDKFVLVIGVLAVLAALSAALGMLAVRHRLAAVVGVSALAAAGVAAALTRPSGQAQDVLPVLLGAAAGLAMLLYLLDMAPTAPAADRREFLRTASVTVVGAAVAGLGGRALQHTRFNADASRAAVRLPQPTHAAPAVSASTRLHVRDITPLITSNADFYRIDTAIVVPQVATKDWRLRIHGMVERPMTLTYADLLSRPLIERYVTLACVSNEVGGDLISTSRFLGVPLAPLLREAGVRRGADQVVSRSTDGWTSGTPTAVIMDGRDAMLAVGMNGQPLPVEHGFPVRMLVPGLYGYVSATKWLVDLELSTFSRFTPYWVERGYAAQAPIKTESRIDTPGDGAQVSAGTVVVAGIAWAQHTGIAQVQVRVDGGPWQQARLAAALNVDTWRQWVWKWQARPGKHELQVRATDRSGYVQTGDRVPAFPDGSTGWHTVTVTVQ